MSENPLWCERVTAPIAVADRQIVAGPRVQRQPTLGRIPAVVLVDQLVDVVEAPGPSDLVPALGEAGGIALVLVARPLVGALQPLLVPPGLALDLLRPIDEARNHAGLQIALD